MSTPSTTAVLAMRGGCVELGGRPVLRGVDLAVGEGELVAILGANGSGKSTLVRALLGLVTLQRGEVELFGTPLARFRQWRRIGYVPQRTSAGAGVPASVREVVATGRLASRPPLRPMRASDREHVRAAIEAVGLSDRARDSVASLSGGQQQRVLIARALAGDPDLLVLDEPTAGVDLTHQDALAEVVGRLLDRGTTIVLVAHEMGPLEPLIARTVAMRDGRVAYDGPPLPTFQHTRHDHHHPQDGSRRPPSPHRVELGAPIDRAAGGGGLR